MAIVTERTGGGTQKKPTPTVNVYRLYTHIDRSVIHPSVPVSNVFLFCPNGYNELIKNQIKSK